MKKLEITLHKGFYPLSETRQFVSDTCRFLGANGNEMYNIKTAVDEALNNILEHAYENTKDKIKIKVAADQKKITITIIDWGKTFVPSGARKRSPLEIIKSKKGGGLGMNMMEKIMDKITYRRKKTRNELVMVKFTGDTDHGRK